MYPRTLIIPCENYYIYENYHFHHSACTEIGANDVISIRVLPKNSLVKNVIFVVIVLHGSVVV